MDPYTAGHSERVAHYSATIAKILRFTDEEVENIRIAALMHDVGKIGIQDSILGKAGPLTDEEFAIMKTHPTKGAAIMEHVPQLKSMIPGMKYHHENVDGSGYPEGLKGDQIPLIAKVVSVADTFDAMTTNRPYQKAMEITYVFARMRSFIGKKFEKHIVEALITGYEEGLIRPDMKVESVLKPVPLAPAPPPPAVESSELPAPRITRVPAAAAPAFAAPPPMPSPPASRPVIPTTPMRAEETHGMGPPPALMDRIR
jgi:HD superfamily phosphohydrolase YqeK